MGVKAVSEIASLGVRSETYVHGGGRAEVLCARARVLGVAWLCVLAGFLALGAHAALALEAHVFAKSFAGEGTHALSAPKGVAINQSTGDVYVVDSANNRVEVFSASGAFVSTFGKAGTGNGEFKAPTGIAVDNSSSATQGYVYVIDAGNNRIEAFNSKGEYKSQITVSQIQKALLHQSWGTVKTILGIAVDASGNLWIYFNEKEEEEDAMEEVPEGGSLKFAFEGNPFGKPGLAVTAGGDFWSGQGPGAHHYSPSGGALESVGFLEEVSEESSVTGVALDPANEALYLDRGNEIAHFPAPQSSAVWASDSFGYSGPGELVAGAGLAVSASTGAVYVADSSSNRVDVYEAVTQASVSTEAPSELEPTSATLRGSVNPEGLAVSECQFEYAEGKVQHTREPVYTNTVPCSPAPGAGETPVSVSATIKGLKTRTTYNYRLSATDANGTDHGGQQQRGSFTTPGVETPLTITTVGDGEVECEVYGVTPYGPCASEYPAGSLLVLRGTPGLGATFEGWSEGSGSAKACTGTQTCVFEIEAPSTVKATFGGGLVPEDTFKVSDGGSGSGTVECEVNGAGHYGSCASEYAEGTALSVKATAAAGSKFEGWSGGTGSAASCSGTSPCSFTITQNSTLTATFNVATTSPEGGTSKTTSEEAKVHVEGIKTTVENLSKLTIAGRAKIVKSTAKLELSCSAGSGCVGSLKLTTKVKHGHRRTTVVVGRASYRLAGGEQQKVKVKLTKRALALVKRSSRLKTTLTGTAGLKQTIVLQLSAAKKAHSRRGARAAFGRPAESSIVNTGLLLGCLESCLT